MRSSPMLSTSNKLMFSLPCLSKTETAYVQLQLDACYERHPMDPRPFTPPILKRFKEKANTVKFFKNTMTAERCMAIARAYQIDKDEKGGLPDLVNLCAAATKHKESDARSARKFGTFSVQDVQPGLEFGEMMGGSSEWLNLVTEFRFNHDKAFPDFTSRPEFQLIYKRRLLEVIDRLGLTEVEHLVGGLGEGKCNFVKFSQDFYEKVLFHLCGISSVSALTDFFKWHRYGRVIDDRKDPVNMLRTYFIMKEVLDMDLDLSFRHIAMLGRVSALDMLVTLNMLEQTLYQDRDQHTRMDLIISDAHNCDQLFIENQFIWNLPVSHCAMLLKEIGFSNREVKQLVMKTRLDMLGIMSIMTTQYDRNMDTFVDLMKRRLILLRKEGIKLGIANVVGTFKFLFKWDEVVKAINKAEVGSNQCFIRFNVTGVKIGVFPGKSKLNSASREYLMEYFGIKNAEDVKELDTTFSRIPHSKDVPLRIVVDSVIFLEGLDFTKQQIREGFPIVFYSKKNIANYIPRVEAALGLDWTERENALSILNYYIEIEHKFSFELIYIGILDSYEEGLSEEFFKELSC